MTPDDLAQPAVMRQRAWDRMPWSDERHARIAAYRMVRFWRRTTWVILIGSFTFWGLVFGGLAFFAMGGVL